MLAGISGATLEVVTSDEERESRDDDIGAFVALPRPWLYGGAAVALTVFIGLAAAVMGSPEFLRVWIPSLVSGIFTVVIAALRRSPAGRGALWTLVGNEYGSRVPRHSYLIGLGLTLILVVIPLGFTLYAVVT